MTEINKIIRLLKKHYALAKCSLMHKNPWELLISTMLSAQCTDERVNQVTKVLFKKYKDEKALAKAKIKDVERIVFSTGFYKNKAKNIIRTSKALVEIGEFPKDMETLNSLDGVGRKTANVVLANAFNVPAVVVDTHVTRLVNRFGVARGKNAVILEKKLQKILNKKDWIMFSHYLIAHGRAICTARKPACSSCFLENLCAKVGV